MSDYRLLASPTLYPGQDVRARVVADGEQRRRAVTCRLFVGAYGADDDVAHPPRPRGRPESRARLTSSSGASATWGPAHSQDRGRDLADEAAERVRVP